MITVDFNRLDMAPGKKILDMGCGEGRHTARASEYPGTLCVGADHCHADLVTAREKILLHHSLLAPEQPAGRWTLHRADITRMPYHDHAFHTVICSEVLEHIPAHNRAVKELVRILRPGGTLVVTVPRQWPERLCWKLCRQYGYGNSPGGHIRIYRAGPLIRKITGQGMTLTHHHHAHALHTPYWWIKCLEGLEVRPHGLSTLYHRLLVWDLMEKPAITRMMDRLLNPIMGKSLVLYFQRPRAARDWGSRVCPQQNLKKC